MAASEEGEKLEECGILEAKMKECFQNKEMINCQMLLTQTFQIAQGFKNTDIIGGLKERSSGHVDGVKRRSENINSTDQWRASEVGSDKAI